MAKDTVVKLLLDLDESGFESGIGSAVKSLGTFAGGLALLAGGATVLKDIGTASITMAANIEQSSAKVSTLFGDVAVNTGALDDKMKGLSNTTGLAVTELNEGLYQALSAGIPVTEDMTEAISFMEKATKLSIAGFTGVEQAVDLTTTVINAYGKDVSETAHIMDVLIGTQNAGKTSVDQLAATMGKAIPNANALGVEFEELSGGMAVLTANGINTAESTTMINALMKEGLDPAGKLNEEYKKISGKTMPELIKEGYSYADVLMLMNDHLIDQGMVWGEVTSSSEAATAAQVLMKDGGIKLLQVTDDLYNSAGNLDSAYAKMETTQQKNSRVQEMWNNSLADLAEDIMPLVNKALDLMIDNAEWLFPLILKGTVAVAGLATVMGGALVVSAIAGSGAMATLTAAMTPLIVAAAPVVLAIGAIGGAWYLLNDDVKELTQSITKNVLTSTQKQTNALEAQYSAGLISYDEYQSELVELTSKRAEEVLSINEELYNDGEISQSEYNSRISALETDLTNEISESVKLRYEDLQKQLDLGEISQEEYVKKISEMDANQTKSLEEEYDKRNSALRSMVGDGTITYSEYQDELKSLDEQTTAINKDIESQKLAELQYRLDQGIISQDEYDKAMWLAYDEDYNKWNQVSENKKTDLRTQYDEGTISYEKYSQEISKLQAKETENSKKQFDKQLQDLDDKLASGYISEDEYKNKTAQIYDSMTKEIDETYTQDLDNLEEKHTQGLISTSDYETQLLQIKKGNLSSLKEIEDKKLADGIITKEQYNENIKNLELEEVNTSLQLLQDKIDRGEELSTTELQSYEDLKNKQVELNKVSLNQEISDYEAYVDLEKGINITQQDEFLKSLEEKNEANKNALQKRGLDLQEQGIIDNNTRLNLSSVAIGIEANQNAKSISETIRINEEKIANGEDTDGTLALQNEALNAKLTEQNSKFNSAMYASKDMTYDQIKVLDSEMGTNFENELRSMGFTFDVTSGKMVDKYGRDVSTMNKEEIDDLILDVQTNGAKTNVSKAVKTMESDDPKVILDALTQSATNEVDGWIATQEKKTFQINGTTYIEGSYVDPVISGGKSSSGRSSSRSLVPNVPAFAKGGVVDGAGYGLIGEAGPEMILPLNSSGADFISNALKLDDTGRVNKVEVNINGNLVAEDPKALARTLVDIIDEELGGRIK